MSEPTTLAEQLTLVDGGDDVFTWPGTSQRRVFGGMLVAHALAAADATTTDDRTAHALHASFIGGTDGRRPLRYEVERTRDGGSFSSRRVVTRQDDGPPSFLLTANFQAAEAGLEWAPEPPAGVPPPDDLPVGRYAGPWFDSRDVPPETTDDLRRMAWFRAREPQPDDARHHLLAVAYLTDHGPTRAVREPHADHPGVERRMSVSLDHSVWFHRPARVDEWLLSDLRPMSTGAARGLATGSIWTADGDLVATVAQEALLRLPER